MCALTPPALLATGESSGLALMALIAIATLVSEDAACIGTGLLIAQGRIGFAAGSFACFAGIYVGDLMLFWAGRALGRPALERAPLRRWVTPDAVSRASAWLERRGPVVIALSRLTPGARLPTYFAAGLLRTNAPAFAGYFLLAAAIWTPALVALSMGVGRGALEAFHGGSWAVAAGLGLAFVAATRVVPPLLTHRGRRLAIGRWRRIRRWEFWPLPVFYLPIAGCVAWLALRHRSLTLPTAANPAIPGGGFAGESKHEILRGLAGSPEAALRATRIPGDAALEARVAEAESFLSRAGLGFPVVVKPDLGERGAGVSYARDRAGLERALASIPGAAIVQEFAPGPEFGIFYVREPGAPRGRIFSITEKVLPVIRGDGVRTIEELILDDERAVCLARVHLARFADRLAEVPAAGEEIRLVEVGTHSRGAIFRDAGWARTPALEAAIDDISRRFEGFHFGRYDVKVGHVRDLLEGRNLRIVELNGLTAEATHIYDPRHSLLAAYRTLFEQWRIAFAIGAANRGRGARPTPLRELIGLVRQARASSRGSGRSAAPRNDRGDR